MTSVHRYLSIGATHRAQWERIKGEIRALTAMNESIQAPAGDNAWKRAAALRDKSENFIAEIEARGLYQSVPAGAAGREAETK